ncbi:hypothetical protein [Streptomyces sp. NBC_01205]|uniref:hypothetical protein n=1 Tax=Streptomyces sp. NBC_01205 TaxID=2903771 RepID=UPI002E109F9A|nr:hypothetical protein OG573_43340 [Streptomyces sp. NBC_01205]
MAGALRVIVYPPDAEGGRRVRVDGEILGRATGPGDILEFLRRAGLDPDNVDLGIRTLGSGTGYRAVVWACDNRGCYFA